MGSNYFNKCGSCSHLNPQDRSGYRYYCNERKAYYPLDDNVCSRYDYDKYRDFEELYRIDNPSGCYITTMMCEVMNLPDDNVYLNTLRQFRDNILQKDPSYYSILLEYDIVGPLIADAIKKDKDANKMVRTILTVFISPMLNHIENGRYVEAVEVYAKMVNLLKDTYGFGEISKQISDYDASYGGHGYVYRKQMNK